MNEFGIAFLGAEKYNWFIVINLKNKWSDLDHQLFRNIRGYFKTQLNKKPVVLLHIIKGE